MRCVMVAPFPHGLLVGHHRAVYAVVYVDTFLLPVYGTV